MDGHFIEHLAHLQDAVFVRPFVEGLDALLVDLFQKVCLSRHVGPLRDARLERHGHAVAPIFGHDDVLLVELGHFQRDIGARDRTREGCPELDQRLEALTHLFGEGFDDDGFDLGRQD